MEWHMHLQYIRSTSQVGRVRQEVDKWISLACDTMQFKILHIKMMNVNLEESIEYSSNKETKGQENEKISDQDDKSLETRIKIK